MQAEDWPATAAAAPPAAPLLPSLQMPPALQLNPQAAADEAAASQPMPHEQSSQEGIAEAGASAAAVGTPAAPALQDDDAQPTRRGMHHLTRHWLPDDARGDAVLQRLGASDVRSAEQMIRCVSVSACLIILRTLCVCLSSCECECCTA